MKQFHWGHGILVFFIFYISYLVWTVVASRQVDHSLVLDDYYALDLAYEDHYQAAANSLHSNMQPDVVYNEDSQQLEVDFKDVKSLNGTVHLYRPSSAAMDKHYKLDKADDDNRYFLDLSSLEFGKWVVKTKWSQGNLKYYKEDVILITKP